MAPPIGFKHSRESREKIRKFHTGKPGGMLGKKHSKETREKMSKSRIGKHPTEETKEKLRILSTGRKLTKEAREKISKAKRGRKRKPFTKETREKMSKNQKDMWKKLGTSISKKRPTKYLNGKQKYISHIIWEENNGEIPKGFEIHHKDLNPENNKINNLLMLSRLEHQRAHRGP